MRKKNILLLGLIILLSGCGTVEEITTEQVTEQEEVVINESVVAKEEAPLLNESTEEQVIKQIEEAPISEVLSIVYANPELITEEIQGYCYELEDIRHEMITLEAKWQPLTDLSMYPFPESIDPAYVNILDTVRFDVFSMDFRFVGQSESGVYLYEGNEVINYNLTGNKIDIYSLNPLVEPSGVSATIEGLFIKAVEEIADGFARTRYTMIAGQEFMETDQAYDWALYTADKENVEYIREDILACLKGETPENKAASVEEIYAGINY